MIRTRRGFSSRLLLGVGLVLIGTSCGDPTDVPVVPIEPVTPVLPPGPNAVDILIGEIDMAANAEFGGPGGAIFRQSAFETSSGTGVVNPFLRTSTSATAFNVFNTSATGANRPTTVDNPNTTDIRLSAIPSVTIGGTAYRELRLDINQIGNLPNSLLSLDVFKIYVTTSASVPTDANNFPVFPAGTSTLVYDLDVNSTPAQDTWLKMNGDLSSGSGGGDIFFYIPESAFGAAGLACPYDGDAPAPPGGQHPCPNFMTLVARFGDHYVNNDGFEEFAVRKLPFASKTAAWTYDEMVSWTITKKVDKAENGSFAGDEVTFDLWNGESATAYYKVSVQKTVTKVNNKISGVITVTNPASKDDYPAVTATDMFQGINAQVTCPATPLLGGTSVQCDYVVNLGATEPTLPALNTAVATIVVSPSLTLTMPAQKMVTGPGTFSGTTTGAPGSITVTDAFDGGSATNLGTNVTQSTTFNVYSHSFTCGAAEGSHPNTATIVQTGQTDNANVVVNCHNLSVTKTAVPAFTRTYSWTITKQVKKQGAADGTYGASVTYDMFNGDEGVVTYKVNAARQFSDGSFGVTGVITISNPSAHAVIVHDVDDAINQAVGAATVTACAGGAVPDGTVPNQRTIAAGGSLTCDYSKSGIASPGSTEFTNTATVQGRITSGGSNKQFTGSANFTFAGVTPSISGPETVTVTDAFDGGAPVNLVTNYDGTTPIPTFDKTLSCPSTDTYPNQAKIVETGQTANASVTINCYQLTVTKTANAKLDRRWTWDLVKARGTDEPETITLPTGGTYNYAYKLTLNATPADENWRADGVITISNPAPIAAAIAEVADTVLQGATKTAATVTGAPATVPAKSGATNGTATANYSVTLPNGTNGTNTATVRTQNRRYTGSGAPTNITGTTPYTGTNNVTFPGTVTQLDNCVKVFDNKTTGTPIDLGVVCAPGDVPKTFEYNVDLAAPMACDASVVYTNIANAYFFANGNVGLLADGPAQVSVTVKTAPCPVGCTLTQGYWKTHNESFGSDKKKGRKGPPIHVFSGASAPWNGFDLWKFFGGTPAPVPTGIIPVAVPPGPTKGAPTWFTNFTTPPQGNPYYQASHQFMAAMLNVAAGASGSAVDADLKAAYEFFLTASPTTKWDADQRAMLLGWASKFASYNEGSIGPGHCSEDKTSLAAAIGF